MDAVVEKREVRLKIQDVDIPDIHFGHYFRSACHEFQDRTALIDGTTDDRWSYAQLLELSSRVAAGLQKLGFEPGQMAGLHCDVTPDMVFAFYGAVLAGGSVILARSKLTKRELGYQFGDACPSLVFCDEANADKILALQICGRALFGSIIELPGFTLVVFGTRENMVPFAALKATPLRELRPVPSAGPDQLVALIYSSGTTGLPKGVMLSSKNLIANVCIARSFARLETNYVTIAAVVTCSPLAALRVLVRVVDVNTGMKLGPREHGEIRVKGPTCVSGYFKNPEATAKLYDSEGFLLTGTAISVVN
ncbi:putative 4-coumarate--CoA ligase 1 [Ixodes scapularis]